MTRKIKVLFTIPNFDTAGSQYVVLSIINKLDKNLFDIFIGVEKRPELIPDNVPNANKVHLDFTGDFFKDVYRFAKLTRRLKIDVVHSWDYKSSFIEAMSCRLTSISYLYTKKNASWSKRWFTKSLLSKQIAYDHPEMKSRFFNHFLFRTKVSFVPHGIDLEKFSPTKSSNIEQSVFKLCCVGTIDENKNQLFIIKQLKDLPQTIHLYLFGKTDAAYLEKLNSLIGCEGLDDRVHIKAFVQNAELPNILNRFDLFVLASYCEGLPVSILEALACGVPVLCSDSGGGTRYIFKDGKGGVVFDLNQPEQFNDALMTFFQDKSYFQQKKKEAILLAKTFDIHKEVEAYTILYQKLS
jgi:glycosyltransferase involved in cell wall biosynthesis